MKRRQFLAAGAGGLAATAIAKPAIAQAMPEVRWRLTSSFPKNLDTIYGTAETFARFMREATDGKFQIQTFSGGEIVPPLQALDAVTNGSVELAHTPTYFYFGKDPTLAFGTGVPFGLNARLQHAWWHFAGGGDIVNEALRKFNAIGLPCGNSGTQMGGWFRKEINSIDDLKGLKFRIGGTGGIIMQKLGVVPQQIAAGDVYPALERGTLDAAEFVGPYDDEKLGFAKVAPYYYYPGWWEGGAMLHLCINLEKWNSLTPTYQAILRQAAEAANNWMLAKYDAVNAPALLRLIRAGVQVKPFPVATIDAAYKATQEIFADIGSKNPLFKKANDSMVAFRGEQYPWWAVGEYSYDGYMIRAVRS
ncbi:MAG TPA: TRAP transporter substrate-binding protein DctP [Beijerinckiaceae bacterium]|nr:TRAP transporter substrate-binding protein DctP [Beijerinckiaceae bacterium]